MLYRRILSITFVITDMSRVGELIETSPVEGVLVDEELNVCQQHRLAGQRPTASWAASLEE